MASGGHPPPTAASWTVVTTSGLDNFGWTLKICRHMGRKCASSIVAVKHVCQRCRIPELKIHDGGLEVEEDGKEHESEDQADITG